MHRRGAGGAGFSLEDVQVSTYLDASAGGADAGPRFFVVVLRVGGPAGGPALSETARSVQERLAVSFAHLAKGELVEAQVAAVEVGAWPAEPRRYTPSHTARDDASYDGRVLGGDFRLERKLASGGMSEVYLATQVSLQRTVAVKLFRWKGPANDESLVRFNRESLTLAQFSCPSIVQVLAAGADESLNWMAMEHLAGGDLGGWIERTGRRRRSAASAGFVRRWRGCNTPTVAAYCTAISNRTICFSTTKAT